MGLQQIKSLGVRGTRAKKPGTAEVREPWGGKVLWGILTGQGLWAQARLKVTLDPLRSTVPGLPFPFWVPHQEAESLTQASAPPSSTQEERNTLHSPN